MKCQYNNVSAFDPEKFKAWRECRQMWRELAVMKRKHITTKGDKMLQALSIQRLERKLGDRLVLITPTIVKE